MAADSILPLIIFHAGSWLMMPVLLGSWLDDVSCQSPLHTDSLPKMWHFTITSHLSSPRAGDERSGSPIGPHKPFFFKKIDFSISVVGWCINRGWAVRRGATLCSGTERDSEGKYIHTTSENDQYYNPEVWMKESDQLIAPRMQRALFLGTHLLWPPEGVALL